MDSSKMPSQETSSSFASLRDKILTKSNGKEYWRSVEEFVDAPEFEDYVKREFPDQAETWDNSLSRRNFIKVMGASLALAGLSGCVIQPPEKIVPYVRPIEDMLPGKPLFFATAMTMGGVASGLLARSYEGRPVKLEGNPEHPGSLGATDIFAQAALLDMYDPDRSRQVMFRGSPSSWQNFMAAIRAAVEANAADGGAGVRFLTPTVTSPTLQAQFRQLLTEMPNAKWVQYEAVNNDNALAGSRLAFGSPSHAVYRFDRAARILSLDADIFSGANVRYMHDFAEGRRVSDVEREMNRLYAIETTMTLMGAKADHRLAVKPSQMFEVAKAVAKAIGVAGAESSYTENGEWIAAMAKDLSENRGRTLVVAGDNQPAEVHALACLMNSTLGNIGETVVYTEPLAANTDKTQLEQLRELVSEIDGGQVKVLVMLGGNPVYSTPADLKIDLNRVDSKVPLRIHLGSHYDETAEICHWHVPEKHFLEMWGDARAYDGTVSFIQPLIEPLYGGGVKSAAEIVQLFFRENFDRRDYDIHKDFWQAQNLTTNGNAAATPAAEPVEQKEGEAEAEGEPKASPAATPASPPPAASGPRTFEDHWRKAIHDGFVANSALPAKSVTASSAFLEQPAAPTAASGPLEIAILPDPCIYDGRFANNGWMQELPNPFTKITWENVALISPATAERLQVNRGNDPREISGGERGISFVNTYGSNMGADLVKLSYQGLELEGVPMWISPGQPDDVITIFLGYGRSRTGKVGTGLGYNAYNVRRSDAMHFGFGNIERTGGSTQIATTQIHFNMENVDGRSRDILRVWDIHHFDEHLEAGKQPDYSNLSMYDDTLYQQWYAENHKWGMSIDLNTCVGCNACVLACQSENNIPVVGKDQVEKSREMHWMRIDTYYGGEDVNQPEGPHFQPVLCMQCEMAPCEVVCPVTATVHNPEGLNDMVYNRCVGTRYCSNNCPYKVRRFNFFLYQDWDTPQYKLMRNPEVTIRSRGVMEKCTYCTQRISVARIEAEKEGRRIRDGEVLTACQSVCPTGAIVFGDMNDPLSKVAKVKSDKRNYNLLNDLNTQPRTTYMAEMKNKNREMPGYVAPEFKPKPEGKEKPGGGH
ncbi:MAG TPA: TAT-variant-translocated molybdopterin oxidoreductase [Pyrinomonadaceae bacterium]|nr:TAT-variant-translocated molybdopterin oxidoreductase [Pyrinomonadaceae bacterium]